MNRIALLSATPSPSVTAGPGSHATHGAGFFVLALVLVGALLISLWRLRRRTSGPET